jgi:hypothetical protein
VEPVTPEIVTKIQDATSTGSTLGIESDDQRAKVTSVQKCDQRSDVISD